jgi:pyruvate dehydrogenase E2 component (dihydrolipoamide acetyltransferase)
VPASAPKGRVGKEDVQAYLLRHAVPLGQAGSFVPHSSMRRSMAAALTHAKQAVPHFYTAMDIAMDALLGLRGAINAAGGEVKVSINDVLLKAVALALRDVPEVNAHVAGDGVHRYPRADIAFAVAIEGGLLTPVIRDVTGKDLATIARESQALADKARGRRLAAEDIKGATFTVSNLGMFGVRSFDAIISPPQAGILAVGGVRREPAERADGGVVFRSATTVTLSADHRAVDGAVAARFLQALKAHCEAPEGLGR